MKSSARISASLVLCGLIVASGARPAQSQAVNRDLMAQSSIVFVGTVMEVGGSILRDVPPSPNTIVVQVDRVLDKPAVVNLKSGDRVTVFVRIAGALQNSDRATFYTTGALFGDTVAVTEVGHEMAGVTAAAMAQPAGAAMDARNSIDDETLRARLEAATAVVVGRVKEIRIPTIAALAAGPKRISEHNADWREAVIEVQSAIKGANVGDEIVVRFPASRDVAWFMAPKFEVGQVRSLILEPDTATGVPMALHAGAEVQAFIALTPESVAPAAEAQRLRSLMPQ